MRKVLGIIAAALSIASVVTACSGDLAGPLEPTVTASRNVIMSCGGGDLQSVGLAVPNASTLGAPSVTGSGRSTASSLELSFSTECCGGPNHYQALMTPGGGVSLSPNGPQPYASSGGCYDYCYMMATAKATAAMAKNAATAAGSGSCSAIRTTAAIIWAAARTAGGAEEVEEVEEIRSPTSSPRAL